MKFTRKIPIPIFLLLLALVTYALFFWQRGFYWDEAPWTWIYFRLGPAALTKTFSTSRPFWGMLYQLLLPLIGPRPWIWQMMMVLLRWLSAVLVWAIFRLVWSRDERPAVWASALFLVYPGLGQNYIALMYSHFYIILNAFLLSIYLSILGIRRTANNQLAWPYQLAALLLSLINLLTMEYFYFLEFFRLILLWLLAEGNLRNRILRALRQFAPFLGIFLAVTFWRAFFFTNQNASYGYGTLQAIRENALMGILKLAGNMLITFWETIPHAWLFPFEPVDLNTLGIFSAIGAFGLCLVGTPLLALYLGRDDDQPRTGFTLTYLALGLSAWLLGGGAFWLVGERTLPQLHFSVDRFTMPFMLGSSLILTALLGLLNKWPRLQVGLLALLLAFSAGKQFQTNSLYRHDWDTQRALFWQMSWRIPAMQPGTTLLSNDLPVTLFSDNSLSGPLNWIYSPPGSMNHILYFASVRTTEGRALGTGLVPGIKFKQNYLATTFNGDTSKMVVFVFEPPACLRVLDPEVDQHNKLIPALLRDAAALSNQSMILPSPAAVLPEFYQPEIARGWCFDFARAELARQTGDWQTVNQIYRRTLKTGVRTNDPLEYFVFIEALAHSGDWKDAQKLTMDAYKVSKEMTRPSLCALWKRIEGDTAVDQTSPAAVQQARMSLACP